MELMLNIGKLNDSRAERRLNSSYQAKTASGDGGGVVRCLADWISV